MDSHFGLSIRLLAPTFHGRRDGGEREWPPSPLRVFQSLVAAAARGNAALTRAGTTTAALQWLEGLAAPTLLAPADLLASPYRLSVPNNAMDIVAEAWCRGNDSNSGDADPRKHRTMKTVRPTWLLDHDQARPEWTPGHAAIHYLWPLPAETDDEVRGHLNILCEVARGVVALGWGIDMAVGHGAVLSQEAIGALSGEPWIPDEGPTSDGLRVPVQGTLEALIRRYEGFAERLGPDGFTAPPPLSAYRTVRYRRASAPPRLPAVAFSLLNLEASGFHPFDPARKGLTVAGMMRHATRSAAKQAGWEQGRIDTFVLGHGEQPSADAHVSVGPRRFAYLPLPSIENRGPGKERAGSIRRLLLSSFATDCDAEMTWARRALPGQELINEDTKQPIALLTLLPTGDAVVKRYREESASWATVTPVVLPGYDDRAGHRRHLAGNPGAEEQRRRLELLGKRIDGLLRKAITQAGYSQLLAAHADLEWSRVGFWPGVELASHYGVPDHLKRFPRFHVRIDWRDTQGNPVRVPGPVCLGSGRFIGLGLFASQA